MQKVLPVLRELMPSRNCVAFVGAGFSMLLGMPGWKGLLERLVEHGRQCVDPDSLNHASRALEENDLQLAASLVEDAVHKDQIQRFLEDTFDSSLLDRVDWLIQDRMRKRMRSLGEAEWAGVITTNYDELVEQALRDAAPTTGRKAVPLTDSKLFAQMLSRSNEDRIFIVKLHGSLTSEKIVLSTEEYDQAYLRDPQISTFLVALMLRYHLVFVGCSLTDEVIRIRRKLAKDLEQRLPVAYAILERSPLNEARISHLKKNAVIEPIWYPHAVGPDSDRLGFDEILAELAGLPKKPAFIRKFLRYKTLPERFAQLGFTSQGLLAHIASNHGRHFDLEALSREIANEPNFPWIKDHHHVEHEIRFRFYFLISIGLLLEEKVNGKTTFVIPDGLTDEVLARSSH